MAAITATALLSGFQLQQTNNLGADYYYHHHQQKKTKTKTKTTRTLKISANLGGGGGGRDEGELMKKEKNKFITKEEEPQQYWQTAGERKGENPMKTPLPYIIIFGMSTPFVILAIAFANGWIKVPIR